MSKEEEVKYNDKFSKEKMEEIIRVTKLFNKQTINLNIKIFKKIEYIYRYYGTPGFTLKKMKNIKNILLYSL